MRPHRPLLHVAMAWMAALPVVVLLTEGNRPVNVAPIGHLVSVCIAAGIAGAAAWMLTLAGVRGKDGRTVLLSAAFSTMTALLLVHGLATPGVIVGNNGVIALAGGLSLPVGALVLSLTALPAMRRPRSVREMVLFQIGLFVIVVDLGVLGMLFPSIVPGVPAAGSAPAIVLLVIGAGLYGMVAARATRTFALTHRPTDLLAAVGCAWLGVALVPQLITGYGTLSFYAGHAFEVLGIAMVAVPAVLDLYQGASRPLVGDLSLTEVVLSEERFLGARVHALLLDLERKDVSTEQHTRRVAMLAVRVGEELKLPPNMLRQLAVGGLLHDIGKLAVPTRTLTKPGKLTDAEFDQIKKHPGAGVKLLKDLGGFSDEVLRLVGQHHERLDGSGYPDGLAGPELGIGPRLLAVCDVYDALTSDRVYRGAWEIEEAFGLLRRDAGSKLDAKCVHALERVVGHRPPERLERAPATPRVSRRAAPAGP